MIASETAVMYQRLPDDTCTCAHARSAHLAYGADRCRWIGCRCRCFEDPR